MKTTLFIMLAMFFVLSCEKSEKISQQNSAVIAGNEKSCGGCPSAGNEMVPDCVPAVNDSQNVRITFIELGSVNCVPCKKMQPVMKAVEKRYAGQIDVIFYDVWKKDQKKYASQYNIRLIPTQIFLDRDGREIYRHEGFFPEKEICAFLETQGLSAESIM